MITRLYFFVLIFISSSISADVTMDYQIIQQNKTYRLSTIHSKNGVIRINAANSEKPYLLINTLSEEVALVYEKKRSFYQTTVGELSQQAKFFSQNKLLLKGLINAGLQQIKPENKRQAEKIIDQLNLNKPNKLAEDRRLVNTEKSQFIADRRCTVYEVFLRQVRTKQFCISQPKQLKLQSNDAATMHRFSQLILQLSGSLKGLKNPLFESFDSTLKSIQGLPLQIINFGQDGEFKNKIFVSKISNKTIPSNRFIIPKNYQPQLLPSGL